MNPLFNLLGGNKSNNPFTNMMGQLNTFMSAFKGDPKAEVQKLLNNGQMTQQQYSQLSEMASQILPLLK